MSNLDPDIEERAVAEQLERLLEDPKVRQAMSLRCEQTSHDYTNACSPFLQVYEVCIWCGSKR